MRQLKVVRPYGYPARFNTPRQSRHQMVERRWLPLHKLWQPLEVALLMPAFDADLIATFNRIPVGRTPFVISFESHLPRLFTYEETVAFRFFTSILASERCRAIIPISNWARRIFQKQHSDSPLRSVLEEKLTQVIYPSIPLSSFAPVPRGDGKPLRAIFVGAHFARKGGPAVLLAAKEALRRRANIEFHIVSDLTIGQQNGVWTDPSSPDFLQEELCLLGLTNVVHHGKLPNAELLNLLGSCDVGLLPTLSDTFGYSVLECFGKGLPVIATRCCALPELITPGRDGDLIDLPLNEDGEWAHLFRHDNNSVVYREILRETYAKMSISILGILQSFEADRSKLATLSANARSTVSDRFGADRQGRTLERLYERALSRGTDSEAGRPCGGDLTET